MAHFAHVDENNIVTQVIVAEQDVIDTGIFGDPASWIQTSYNTHAGIHYGPDGQPDGGFALRKNYAAPGMSYDPARDAFISPQPYPSWILDEDSCDWLPPVPLPAPVEGDPRPWIWDEETLSWVQPLEES